MAAQSPLQHVGNFIGAIGNELTGFEDNALEAQRQLKLQRREEQKQRQDAAQTAKARKERVMARRAQRGQRSRRAGTQASDAGGLSLDRVIGGTSDTIG